MTGVGAFQTFKLAIMTIGADVQSILPSNPSDVRGAQMARIRKTNTKPELVVRRIAHALGLRFRLHCRELPGTPDVVFPRHKKAILVHGCFWHQHEGCRLARQPKSRLDYWLPKLARNVERDAASRAALEQLGWRTMVVWECEVIDTDALRERIRTFMQLGDQRPAAEAATPRG